MAIIYKGAPKKFSAIHDKKSKPIYYSNTESTNTEDIVPDLLKDKSDELKNKNIEPVISKSIEEEELKDNSTKEVSTGTIGYKPVVKPANIIYDKNNIYRTNNLNNWVQNTKKLFTDEEGNFLDENDPRAVSAITGLWGNINILPDDSKFKGKPIQETAWSAATIGNGVIALTGKSAKELKENKHFRAEAQHSIYINDAIKNSMNKGTRYDLYAAKKLDGSIRDVGDILFKGREGSKKWEFDDFVKAVDEDNFSYDSHSEIITGKGKDDKGTYYEVAGGNVGNTLNISKVYYDPKTGKLLNGDYKGVLEFNQKYKGGKTEKQEFIDKKPESISMNTRSIPSSVPSLSSAGKFLSTLR